MARPCITYMDARLRDSARLSMVHETTLFPNPADFPAFSDVSVYNTVVIVEGDITPEIKSTQVIVSTKALNPFPDSGYYNGYGSTLAFTSGKTVATGFPDNAAAIRSLFELNRMHSQWMDRPITFTTAKLTNAVFSGKLSCRLSRSKLIAARRSRPSNNFVGITFHCPRPNGVGSPLTLIAFETGRLNFPGARNMAEVRYILTIFYADIMQCIDVSPPRPTAKKLAGLQRTTTRKTHRVKDLNKHSQFLLHEQTKPYTRPTLYY